MNLLSARIINRRKGGWKKHSVDEACAHIEAGCSVSIDWREVSRLSSVDSEWKELL